MASSAGGALGGALVEYGTPLPEYEEDEVPSKKPIHVEDQVVTDEKGRRRFHGAFTGGFSAGFFNTVGSEQGWAPSTFVSSRSDRANRREQRPEDYMDTDDLGEFGIAPRSVQVTEDFADANRKRPAPKPSQGPIPGDPVLETLVIPVTESKGVRMLRKLGWKPGQGIGPRVKSKVVHQDDVPKDPEPQTSKEKVYGCSLPPSVWRADDRVDDDEDDFTLGQLYAPDDVDPAHFTPKADQHGIGYKGLDRRSILTLATKATAVIDGAKKLAIAGEAFGVGAFERDDESVYTTEDMSQYDFDIGDADDPKAAIKRPIAFAKQGQGTSYVGKILEGFHLSTKPPPKRDMYAPPDLPRDFRPVHRRDGPVEEVGDNTGRGLNRHSMNANDRGKLIEEQPGPKSRKFHEGSVLNLLSARDRARLEVMSKFALGQAVETNAQKYSSDGRFRPFASDPLKQERFEVYTKLNDKGANMREDFPAHQPSTMTDWEKMHESEEFQRAASLYKPLRKSAMMSRFVPASVSGEIEEPKPGLTLQAQAAKAKKYGEFTREKFKWHPDKILCRRFNIPNPYPDSTTTGVPKEKRDKFSIFDFLAVEAGPDPRREPPTADKPKQDPKRTTDPVQKDTPALANAAKPADDDPSEKPSLDLFKAIFEDSASDKNSSSEDEVEEPAVPPPRKVVSKPQPTVKTPIQEAPEPLKEQPKRPVEPSKGVFAKVDFDRLNTRGPPVLNFVSDIDVEVFNSVPQKDEPASYGPRLPPGKTTNSDVYGPSLPPPSRSEYVQNAVRQDSNMHRKKSHKDKSKKHKKDKHKSKKKRSRSSKRKSSESSSSTEDEVQFVPADDKEFNKSILCAVRNLSKR